MKKQTTDQLPRREFLKTTSAGLAGLPGQLAPGDADLITLIDVSKRPFRAVQHLTVTEKSAPDRKSTRIVAPVLFVPFTRN